MATVNFIRNSNQSGSAMGATIRYVERDDKTRDKQFVSGQNCSPQLAEQEFLTTRAVNRKNGGRWFYHYTQSFSPQENVTPELAHEIAKEFAARAWPDSEVVIATHVDAAHVHSHFVVNAVCFETGKMLRQHPDTLQKLRAISDELCMAHGLSVLPSQKREQKSDGVSAREYRSAIKGESWKFQLMATVDDCMRLAQSREEFIERMKRAGYRVRWEVTRACITYTTPSGMRCRDKRLHEKKYLKENMEHEFNIRTEILAGRIEADEQPRPDGGERGRAAYHADRPELDGSAAAAGQDVFDAGRDIGDARRAADEAGCGGTARQHRTDDGSIRRAGGGYEHAVLHERNRSGSEHREVASVDGELDGEHPAGDGAQDGRAAPRADGFGAEVDDAARDRCIPAAGGAGDDLWDRHAAEAGIIVTGWEAERAAFLEYLTTDSRDYAHANKLDRILGQTAKTLMYAEHVFDGGAKDAEEQQREHEARQTGEIIGALIGITAGVALAVNDVHKRAKSPTQHIDRKRRDELQDKRIALGHKEDDHPDQSIQQMM